MKVSTLTMREEKHQEKNNLFFEKLPQQTIVKCVMDAFNKLTSTHFGNLPINNVKFSSQIFCSIFHELIVHEISKLPDWEAGKQNKEADLVHVDGMPLQVKTNSNPDGIAGNRHSSKSSYSDPSEYYLCVNFIPNDCICKIRAGWIDSTSWKPQKGKGNASVLKKTILNDVPLLYGKYLNDANLLSVEGVGIRMLEKLHNEGINKIDDLTSIKKYILAKKILRENSMNYIDDILLKIS